MKYENEILYYVNKNPLKITDWMLNPLDGIEEEK